MHESTREVDVELEAKVLSLQIENPNVLVQQKDGSEEPTTLFSAETPFVLNEEVVVLESVPLTVSFVMSNLRLSNSRDDTTKRKLIRSQNYREI